MSNTIAVCVIAKNEEKNVHRMSESIKGLFDEYIFVDTGSTDKTVDIAYEIGWKIHGFNWVNDFAKARNHAFSLAKSDFIFWMDLDDVLANPEGFKNWKEVVMPLYDYHLANYNYAMDPTGKPLCTFVRERVIRRSKGMKWEYPVHEGITPTSANGPVSVNFTSSWWIDHMRTGEDLAKDKTRNLAIFEHLKETGQMNPRMQYYYGKELFEHGDPTAAVKELEVALKDRSLDPHDRMIATQYIAFSHIQLAEKFKDTETKEKATQYGAAINHAINGVLLAPTRAEYFSIIADAFLKQGNPVAAIPFYKAATGCIVPDQKKVPSPIFRHEDVYGHYPLCQLARIHANMQDFEKARDYAREAFDKFGSNESRAILAQVDSITTAAESYKLAKPCEDIVFTTPPMHAYPFDPDMAKEKACGGSETALIEMAKWLHKKSGRKVKVFMMREDMKTFDGVEYIPNSQVSGYMAMFKPWLHIAWRHSIRITSAPTFCWAHDLNLQGAEYTENYDKILCLSPWQKNYMMATQGVPAEKIHITRNGMVGERFTDPVDMNAKDPMQFVFASSPDRGLVKAILVLDKVREKYPVKLKIFYGIEKLDMYGLGDLKKQIEEMLKTRPWIEYMGATQQDELMRHYRSAAFCVQPSDWIETFCLTALELLLCGVFPIFRKVGGVIDTLGPYAEKGMGELVELDWSEPEKHCEMYAQRVIAAIEEEKYKRVSLTPEGIAWENVAEEWLRDLPRLA